MLALALSLAVSVSSAQVGYCGTGRICYSTKFIASAQSGSLALSIISGAGIGFTTGATSTSAGNSLSWDGVGLVYKVNTTEHWRSNQATGGLTTQFGFFSSSGSGSIGFKSTGAGYWQATGQALTSFPTCDAGHAGAWNYDSTNAALSFCNGSAWSSLQTAITLPTPVALSNGGTAKALTAVNGGAVWSDADSLEITAAGSTGQVLRSAGAASPTWGSGLGARTQVDNLAIGAAGATFGCATATNAVTGCAQGKHVEITPLQDDVAWDTGVLWAFCEDTDVVKVIYCGGSSADPANTNDYYIDVTTP